MYVFNIPIFCVFEERTHSLLGIISQTLNASPGKYARETGVLDYWL